MMQSALLAQDMMGRPLVAGDYVAYARASHVCVGRVEKICARVIKVAWSHRDHRYNWTNRCLPERVLRLEPDADLTMYYLKINKERNNA